MPGGLGSMIREEMVELLAPLRAAAAEPSGTALLVRAVGHVGELADSPQLKAEIGRLAALAEAIGELDEDDLGSWEGTVRIIGLGRDLLAAVRRLETVITNPALRARAQDLGKELAEALLALHLRARHLRLFRAAAALTLVSPGELVDAAPMVAEGRVPWARDELRFDRLSALLDDPLAVLAAAYLPAGMQKPADAHAAAARLFPLLGDLASSLDVTSFDRFLRVTPLPPLPPSELDDEGGGEPFPPELDEEPSLPVPPLDVARFQREHRPALGFELPRFEAGVPAAPRFGAALVASSAAHPDAVRGFILELFGDASWSETRGDWRLALSASGKVPAFVVGPGGVRLGPGPPPAAPVTAAFTVERIAQPGEPAFALGAVDGLRIEIGALRLRAELSLSSQRSALALSADASAAALVLAADASDGFLDLVLPDGGTRVPFELGLVLSSDRGLELRGGAGLERALAPRVKIGPLTIERLRVALETGDRRVRLLATGTLGLTLGPVRVNVDGLGMEVAGPADFDAGFRPPTGAGIVLDAGLVTGGGFLFYDEDAQQYAGVVQLEFGERLSLKAVGLLTTRLPGGRKGFSLLVVVSVEFEPPIPLVLGLTLSGVGGIVGIHRTMNTEALRDGLRDHALDAVLFPDDPVANATRVIESLRTVFPPAQDRHLLGVAVRIGFSNPPAITAELAVVYEFGGSPRLAIMGQLHVGFPQKSPAKILEVHADGLGIWDVDRDDISVDARLYESRIAFVSFSGDVALRSRGGDDAFFLFSVGGYHPEFVAPPGFPKLDRVKISLADSDNLRLLLTGYLAVSSNTRQIGAEMEFFAGLAGFSIEATLGFDALWEADVRFIVEFDVDFTLKYKGRTLFGVDVNGSFTGPEPKRVQGKWSIDLWLFSVSKTFDKTFGDDRPPVSLPQVDPLPQLVAALKDSRSWSATLPARSRSLVTLRARPAAAEVLVHPFGSLSVRQTVLPLAIRIDRFAGAAVSGGRRFEITDAAVGGRAVTGLRTLHERFAPGEFIKLSDDERIARPSFESMPAGISLQPEGIAFGGEHAAVSEIDFDQKIVGAAIPPARRVMSGRAASTAAVFGPAGRSALRNTGMARFRAPSAAVRLRPERYAVARVDDLTPAGIDGASFTAVHEALERHLAANPGARATLQVVPAFAVEASP
jgi:hypothetical protein